MACRRAFNTKSPSLALTLFKQRKDMVRMKSSTLKSQKYRDWRTALQVNLYLQFICSLGILSGLALFLHANGLKYDPVLFTFKAHYWLCLALAFSIVFGILAEFGNATARAIRLTRTEIERNGRLSPEWWSKRSNWYCSKVGHKAGALQGGRGCDIPKPYRFAWSGPIPFLPKGTCQIP